VGKHVKYSEVKHPDKFALTLSKLWAKSERVVIWCGLAMGCALAVIIVWIVAARLFGGRSDAAWEERVKLAEEASELSRDDLKSGETLLAKMSDLARNYQGDPAAALTLLELAQGHLATAEARQADAPKEAKEHLEKAAAAAEQFVADFPNHRLVALAHYAAGKARLDLGEAERAAAHLDKASQSDIPALATLAQWHAAYCHRQLGRVDEARAIYERIRLDPMAGWCAEQADFALAELGRLPAKALARPPGPAAPPANPAPSK